MSNATGEVAYSFRELFADISGRFDRLEAKFDLSARDFSGFERRMALHEATPGHPQTLERLAALEHDVDGLKLVQQTRAAIEEYLKVQADEAREHRREAANWRRWTIGFAFASVMELGTLLLKVFGVI